MMYFVAYVLSGEAKEWHDDLAHTIAERFGVENFNKKIPPHITIFRPFTIDGGDVLNSADPIKGFLRGWGKSCSGGKEIRIDDFGYFGNHVIFAHVHADEVVVQELAPLQEKLEHEPVHAVGSRAQWRPHTTLAKHLLPGQFEAIWEYVSALEKPDFVLPFDHIALLRSLGEHKWVVDERINVGS